MGVNGESPGLWPGLSFKSSSIVADWVKLLCQLYLVCFHGVRWFVGLTRVFAGVGCSGQRQRRRFGFGGGMGREAGFFAAGLTIRL